MTRRPTVVSLFSGAGGLDLGFKEAGFQIAVANDNDPHARDTHVRNFPESAFVLGSVADFDQGAAEHAAGHALDDVDVLIGGPPCPPFSKSRFYRTDKPRAMADPVAEVTIGGYLRTLKWLNPKIFVLENVPGMAFGVHRETLDYILDEAKELGYVCEFRILNAADFGVAQTRQRFILIGSRVGAISWPQPTHASPDSESPLPAWRTAGSVISDLDTDENAADIGHVAGGKHRDLLVEIPPGDNYLYLTAKRGHPNPSFEWRKRYWSFLLKLSPDLPSWTIQARRSNNMGPLHWRNRILRIEEVKRLQSFPDAFELSGTIEQQWRQVGNAVPPLLGKAIGDVVATRLLVEQTSEAPI